PPRRRRSPPPRARGAARRGLSGAACGAACVGGLRAPGCGAAGVDAAALGLALALCLSLAKEVGFAGPAGATAAPARKRAALSAEPGGVIGDEARLPEKLLAGVLADPRNFQQRPPTRSRSSCTTCQSCRKGCGFLPMARAVCSLTSKFPVVVSSRDMACLV
ncbi:unnamed protein product, partial [Prorocentrum cordatum]